MVVRTTEQLVIESFTAALNQVMTAQQLLTDINNYSSTKLRLDSLSSKLKKMVDDHMLLRVKGYGQRGGYGYLLNPNCKELFD
jgi:hypothetical protein